MLTKNGETLSDRINDLLSVRTDETIRKEHSTNLLGDNRTFLIKQFLKVTDHLLSLFRMLLSPLLEVFTLKAKLLHPLVKHFGDIILNNLLEVIIYIIETVFHLFGYAAKVCVGHLRPLNEIIPI